MVAVDDDEASGWDRDCCPFLPLGPLPPAAQEASLSRPGRVSSSPPWLPPDSAKASNSVEWVVKERARVDAMP